MNPLLSYYGIDSGLDITDSPKERLPDWVLKDFPENRTYSFPYIHRNREDSYKTVCILRKGQKYFEGFILKVEGKRLFLKKGELNLNLLMEIKSVIIDDDEFSVKILKNYIQKAEGISLEQVFYDGNTAMDQWNPSQADILFLDIEMPGLSGFEFLDSLEVDLPVVIVSHKQEYGVQAYEYNCLDYLYKPFSYARFLRAVNKIREKVKRPDKKKEDSEFLFIRKNRMWVKLDPSVIIHIESDGDFVNIHTNEGTFKVRENMKHFLSKLPEDQFMRVHRGHIIKLNNVEKVDSGIIEVNGESIPVSRNKLKELYSRLNIA